MTTWFRYALFRRVVKKAVGLERLLPSRLESVQ